MQPRGNEVVESADCAILIFKKGGDRYKILVDKEDLPKLVEHKWRVVEVNKNRKNPTKIVSSAIFDSKEGGFKTVLLRRFVLGVNGNSKVVHRNNNILDCRKSNLKVVV